MSSEAIASPMLSTKGAERPALSSPPSRSPKGTAFRPDIEGLRGIAIIFVVGYHVGLSVFRGGYIGVDIFFVLSGYLITGLLVNEMSGTGRIDFLKFYARRARRLLPASAVMLITTIAVVQIILPPYEQHRIADSAVATAGYFSNLYFLRQGSDYFAIPFGSNPLLHTWSLAVEEQFYLVWPVLIALALSWKRSRTVLAFFIAGISCLSLAGCLWLSEVRQPWAFFGSPARAWEFGAGALACLLPAAKIQANRGMASVAGWAGLAAILISGAWFTARTPYPGFAVLLPVSGAAVVLVSGMLPGVGVSRILEHPVLQGTGRLSYSWYLWHWPALSIAQLLMGTVPISVRLLCAAGSLGLAWTTWRLIENPIRFNPSLLRRPALSLVLALAVTACGLGFSSWWKVHTSGTPFEKAESDIPAVYAQGCVTRGRVVRPLDCAFGDTASFTTVVLFGDSKAAQWFPPLEVLAKQKHWRLVPLLKSGCPAASLPIVEHAGEARDPACVNWREAAIERILLMRPAAVIVSSYSATVKEGISYSEWRDATKATLARFDAAGLNTLLIRDNPSAGMVVPVCLAWKQWRGSGNCNFDRAKALDESLFRAETEAAASLTHIQVADPASQICGEVTCETVQNGIIVYRDGHHLTARFAATLVPFLDSRIVPETPSPLLKRQ
ncbi:MAG TPA: acyltransferase family protein [Bryobacteraceae bacterium]|nr:acyltransferase family protein [Bryobacteraceae bacterium]